MGEDTKAIIFGAVLAVAWTILIAAATVALAIFSGIDPRNNFWGSSLSAAGVLVVPVFGWPAGLVWIWDEYWSRPKSKRRKR